MSDEISLKQWANRKWTSTDKYKKNYQDIFKKKETEETTEDIEETDKKEE